MITIFTCPKAFDGHIGVIQRNAVRSWKELGPEVEVLLIGEEAGLSEVAAEFGLRHLRDVARNELGTPLVSGVFELAGQYAKMPVLCYANSDVLFLSDFLRGVRAVQSQLDQFLVIGRRWDLRVREELKFGPGWENAIRDRLATDGRLHPPAGSDYFVFPRGMLGRIPPFALGRAGWDNWMIYAGRAAGTPVVDATAMITAIHQDHDYGHLPGGEPHYRLPESRENVELAGGREMIYRLTDADWRITPAGPAKKHWREFGLARWIETKLISSFGPGWRSRIVRMVLHPLDTMGYFLTRLRERLQGLMPSVFR